MTHFSAAKRRGRSAALWGTRAAVAEVLQAWVKPEVGPPGVSAHRVIFGFRTTEGGLGIFRFNNCRMG